MLNRGNLYNKYPHIKPNNNERIRKIKLTHPFVVGVVNY